MGQIVHVHTGNLNVPGSPSSALVVVGVARDVQITPNLAPRLNLYVPMQQKYMLGPHDSRQGKGTHQRRRRHPAAVTSMNPNLPVLMAQTLDSLGGAPWRPSSVLPRRSLVVSADRVLLAAMGIYGVTAYAVARRTREIGIRLSLGAGRSAVVAMILRQGMTLVGIGLTIGLALGLGVGRMLAAQRFGITAPGAATFVAATMLFVVVGLIACYAPCRAIRIAAMDALRYE